MGNSLFQSICRIGIFMICAQAVVHFRPKEAYEKYLKLLVSVMVLIQVFLPIGSFLLGDGRRDAVNALEQFGQELEQGMQEGAEDAADADEILEKMTLEEVLRRMEEEKERDRGEQGGQERTEETGSQSRDSQAGPGQEDETSGQHSESAPQPIAPVVIEPIGPLHKDG
ncbi:MAG: DUF1682 domain-containing protein [Lachnospiraceae bacterium]|nr:DUF1682 domain-containing protein [Lachnospiraceae bacterium]